MKTPSPVSFEKQRRLRVKAVPRALVASSAAAAVVVAALAFNLHSRPTRSAEERVTTPHVVDFSLHTASPEERPAIAPNADFLLSSILRVDDAGLQSDALKQLALRKAQQDPVGAAEWLSHLPTALDRSAAVREVYRVWAERDPRAAADVALHLPAGELRQSALNAILPCWIARDAAGATEWFDAQEPSADFDGVASAIALLPPLVKKRPDVALSWAESITNADERRQRIAIVLGSWFDREPEAALRYLNDTPALTPFQRLTLKEELGLDEGSGS